MNEDALFCVGQKAFIEKNGKMLILNDPSGEIKLSDEHNKFKWVDKSDYSEVDDGSDYFDALKKYFEQS